MAYLERHLDEFHPEKQHHFKHCLHNHFLFQFEELTKLALRNPKVRFHSAKLERTQRFDTARVEHLTGLTLKETLDNIEVSGSFVYIMEIEKDPIYGPLVKEIFKEIEKDVLKFHKKMLKLQAWIFITSPGGITPYHRDFESNHYFHIKGRKTLWLWSPKNKAVVNQEENECFHGVHSLAKTVFTEEKLKLASKYDLTPSMGVFFPYTAPHMVENGNEEFSISLSLTYMTPEDMQVRRIHKINQILRKIGLKPTDIEKHNKLKKNVKLGLHWVLRTIIFAFLNDWTGT
jgi:hypothetical protein